MAMQLLELCCPNVTGHIAHGGGGGSAWLVLALLRVCVPFQLWQLGCVDPCWACMCIMGFGP